MRRSLSLKKSVRVNTVSIEVNVPLLLALIGVVLTTLTEYIVVSYQEVSPLLSFLHYPTLFLLFITLVYMIVQFIQQGSAAIQDRAIVYGIGTSTLLGCFLLGPIGLAMVFSNPANLRFISVIIVLSLGALIALLINAPSSEQTRLLAQRSTPAPAEVFRPPAGMATESQPTHVQYMAEAPTIRRKPRIDPATLPPLFEADPLYAMPHPRFVRFFSAVKGNDSPIANDDACAITANETRLALCDGASASSLPRPWAALLAQQWIKEPLYYVDINTLSQWLAEPRQHWITWVQEVWKPTLDQRNELTGGRPLSSEVVQRTLQTGAAATFLGLALHPQNRTWQATAIGDTCLFFFRRDKTTAEWKLKASIPLDASAGFSDRPPLLSSKPDSNLAAILPHVRCVEGNFRRGDMIVMATDALAQWLLSQLEQGQSDWLTLLSVQDEQTFAHFVDTQRQNNQMADDDTTLVVIPL